MADELERLVLSGKLFSTSSSASLRRSPSRSRSPSPDPLWPTKGGNSTDSDLSLSPPGLNASLPNGGESAERGGQRTGVKGVLRDHEEAVNREQEQRAQKIKETNRRMEKMALNGRTYAEEEEERVREKLRQEGRSAKDQGRERDRRRVFERRGWFGNLREVGFDNYLEAIENEASETWVLIHMYDHTLSRCHDLDASLARLARQYPQTKFLRAHASAVELFSSQYPRQPTTKPQSNLITISEKESYSDDEDGAYFDEEEEVEDNTDKDMLPTMLAYRAGQLLHTWIRVDLEAETWTKGGGKGKNIGNSSGGIEALLQGHYVIQPTGNGNCGFSSDEDDLDLRFSRGDDVDDDELFDL